MELEIKDLDAVLETLDKFHDTLFSINENLRLISTSLFSIAKNDNLFEISSSLFTIKEVMLGRFSETELNFAIDYFINRLKEILDEKK